MNVKTLIIGLGTGLAVGAGAVLFTTPKSGKELQQSIKDQQLSSNELKEEFKARFQTIKESIDMIKTEVKVNLPKTIESIKGSVAQFQEDSAPNQEKLQTHIADLQQTVETISQEIDSFQNRKDLAQ